MGRRRKEQDQRRVAAVRWVVKELFKNLNTPVHQKRIRSTNRLFPVGNLKRAVLRQLFGDWPSEFYGWGRVFTHKLAGECCDLLRKKYGLDPSEMQEKENARLLCLLKASRKHWVMSTMDTSSTLPLTWEDCPDACHALFPLIRSKEPAGAELPEADSQAAEDPEQWPPQHRFENTFSDSGSTRSCLALSVLSFETSICKAGSRSR